MKPLNPGNPEEPGEPSEPTQPDPGDEEPEESCEDNPDQDHCPPPCYCEKLGDWGYLCCVFDCPGMGDFKNFIAFDVVGSAYAPPVPDLPAPSIPNIFDVLNGVDERNPAKPTGQEDPQLGTSSFTADDVMNEAPEIQFNEDPSGGFDILNPLETLDDNLAEPPTQELETIPYPGGSGSSNGGGTPAWNGSEIKQPSSPGGNAKPPDASGSAKPPTTDGSYKYPGT